MHPGLVSIKCITDIEKVIHGGKFRVAVTCPSGGKVAAVAHSALHFLVTLLPLLK